MKHRKIKLSRRKRKIRMAEIYKAKCEQVESLHRKLRAQETSIRLLRKVLDDAQEQRNALELENQELRVVLGIYQNSAKAKKALSSLWENEE